MIIKLEIKINFLKIGYMLLFDYEAWNQENFNWSVNYKAIYLHSDIIYVTNILNETQVESELNGKTEIILAFNLGTDWMENQDLFLAA